MIKLYERESYRTECMSEVLSCEEEKKGFRITLDQSVFFPEEGGQYADTGSLSYEGRTVRLLDGQIRKGEVFYTVSERIPVGTKVKGLLDWDKRFMRMQQHSGEHILSGLIYRQYGYHNVGFHLSDEDPVTLDLDGTLTKEQVQRLEEEANEVIWKNVPVRISFPSKEELSAMEYRSKIAIEGQVRIVTIEGADVCACCAPHVSSTGEIGSIQVVLMQNYKGGTRLGILCGRRALLFNRKQQDLMTALANSLSTRPEQVMGIVNAQKAELAELKGRISAMEEENLKKEIDAEAGKKNACFFAGADLSAGALKNSYNEMTAKIPGFSGIFCGNDAEGYRYAAGSAALDSRELAGMMKERFQAKGGGSREMIQGKLKATEKEIRDFFEKL